MKRLTALTLSAFMLASSSAHGLLNRSESSLSRERRTGLSQVLPREEGIRLLRKPEKEKILASAFIGNGMVTLTTRRLLWLPAEPGQNKAEIQLEISKLGENLCGAVLLNSDGTNIRAVALVNRNFKTGRLNVILYLTQKDGTSKPLAMPLDSQNIRADKITGCVLEDKDEPLKHNKDDGEINSTLEFTGENLSLWIKTEQ